MQDSAKKKGVNPGKIHAKLQMKRKVMGFYLCLSRLHDECNLILIIPAFSHNANSLGVSS